MQPSFFDRRIRNSLEYQKYKDYIWQNPVKRGLARTPEEYPANPAFTLSGTSAAKAACFQSLAAGLKPCSTP